MNMNSVITELLPTLSQEELSTLQDAIHNEFGIRNSRLVMTMKIGDRYSFIHNGERKEGTIIKLNSKSVSIRISPIEVWKVSPNLLTKVS